MTKLAWLVVALLGAACSKSTGSEPPPATSAVAPAGAAAPAAKTAKDPATAKQMIAAGDAVIDVRTPEEFGDGHLPSATNLPVDQLASHLDQVAAMVGNDKTKPIVVYCASGGRASRAAAALQAQGYTDVVNGGGYDDLR